MGMRIALGSKENIMVIHAFKVEGTGIQAIIDVCQMPGVHLRVALRHA